MWKFYVRFYWGCAKRSASGTFERANALWWFVGSGILWAILFLAGLKMEGPTSVTGIIGFAVLSGIVSVALAWVVIFIFRFMLAPSVFWLEERRKRERQQARINELESLLAQKTDKRKIRDGLSNLLMEGQQLLARCADEGKPAPEQETNDWYEKLMQFLRENLEPSFIARVNSAHGLPMTANSIASIEHRQLWGAIYFRLARLNEFIREQN